MRRVCHCPPFYRFLTGLSSESLPHSHRQAKSDDIWLSSHQAMHFWSFVLTDSSKQVACLLLEAPPPILYHFIEIERVSSTKPKASLWASGSPKVGVFARPYHGVESSSKTDLQEPVTVIGRTRGVCALSARGLTNQQPQHQPRA